MKNLRTSKKCRNDKKNLVQVLQLGGIAVVPTDTLYGIVCSVEDAQSIKKLYSIKGRTETKPFIVLIYSFSDLLRFGISLSPKERAFLSRAWPGKVSIVLPCKKRSYSYLTRGGETLAFRMPKSPFIRLLLKKTGPLVAPSANPEGLRPAETIREARAYFADFVDIYESAGKRLRGKPSTLLKLHSDGTCDVLRTGAINIKNLIS